MLRHSRTADDHACHTRVTRECEPAAFANLRTNGRVVSWANAPHREAAQMKVALHFQRLGEKLRFVDVKTTRLPANRPTSAPDRPGETSGAIALAYFLLDASRSSSDLSDTKPSPASTLHEGLKTARSKGGAYWTRA